jgi:hypothetical protein
VSVCAVTALHKCVLLKLTTDGFRRFLSIAPELEAAVRQSVGPHAPAALSACADMRSPAQLTSARARATHIHAGARLVEFMRTLPEFQRMEPESRPWHKFHMLTSFFVVHNYTAGEVPFPQPARRWRRVFLFACDRHRLAAFFCRSSARIPRWASLCLGPSACSPRRSRILRLSWPRIRRT